jgi:hypothetical protein
MHALFVMFCVERADQLSDACFVLQKETGVYNSINKSTTQLKNKTKTKNKNKKTSTSFVESFTSYNFSLFEFVLLMHTTNHNIQKDGDTSL